MAGASLGGNTTYERDIPDGIRIANEDADLLGIDTADPQVTWLPGAGLWSVMILPEWTVT